MTNFKYVFSLTTIKSRIKNIHFVLDSLIQQRLQPENIILNIPKQYSLRFDNVIDNNTIEELKNRYGEKLIVNITNNDYGPGTKLLGLFENNILKKYNEDNTYIVLVDDDLIYMNKLLSRVQYCNDMCDNKIDACSYYCYNKNNVFIGQGADGFFIKLNKLKKFEDYYKIIKNYDFVKYHDDYYISYFFHIKNIEIKHIYNNNKPSYKFLINNQIDQLRDIVNNFNRENLCDNISKLLNTLNKEKKFDLLKE